MDCQDVRKHLKSLSQQPAAADEAVARHLAECADCAAYSDQFATQEVAMKTALSSQPSDEHWRRHEALVRGSLNAFERRRTLARWTWVGAAAAAMLAFAAWGVYSFGKPGETVAKAGPQQPTANSPQPTPAQFSERLASLQESVRSKQVLDELEQLQITFENAGDAEGKSLAEDAELYVERILTIDAQQPEQVHEILAGIRQADISSRLEKLRASLSDDAPAPLQDSIKLAQATLSEASQLGEGK
jgi:hypothetical protein